MAGIMSGVCIYPGMNDHAYARRSYAKDVAISTHLPASHNFTVAIDQIPLLT
jgi:hypothetical protein